MRPEEGANECGTLRQLRMLLFFVLNFRLLIFAKYERERENSVVLQELRQ